MFQRSNWNANRSDVSLHPLPKFAIPTPNQIDPSLPDCLPEPIEETLLDGADLQAEGSDWIGGGGGGPNLCRRGDEGGQDEGELTERKIWLEADHSENDAKSHKI